MTKKIKAMRLIKEKDVVENFDNTFSATNESNIDSANFIIKNVCVFGTRESKNGYIYQDKAIESICRFSEGLKCFLNHASKSETKDRDGVRDIRDWAGVFVNARQEGEKVYADLRCRESAFELIRDIALLQPASVGNSIDARVKMIYDDVTGKESVIDVARLKSGDIVSSAATTQNLFESFSEEHNDPELSIIIGFVNEMLKGKVEDKFNYNILAEGIIQDKVDNIRLRREISDVTYLANDIISDIIYDEKLGIQDKKKKIMDVFNDLDKEVKKRLSDMKESKEGANMELTLTNVKSNTEIMEALKEEFNKESKVREMEISISTLTESLADSDKKVKELTKKVDELTSTYESVVKERDKLKVDIDEMQTKEKALEKKELINKLITESELPKEAITDVFVEDLMKLESTKDGDKEISVEEKIKDRIEDRKNIFFKGNSKVRNTGEEFVEKSKDKIIKIEESDVNDFISKIK